MKRKISCFIVFIILMLLPFNTFVVNANPQITETTPYGPKSSDLKGKDALIKNLNDIKKVRENLVTINISETSTNEELDKAYTELESYLQQITLYKRTLLQHQIDYKDSFADVFFADKVSLIANSYIVSIRMQQNLIRQLREGKLDAKTLFYSDYQIPVYYYLTLGDQTYSYIETYLVTD